MPKCTIVFLMFDQSWTSEILKYFRYISGDVLISSCFKCYFLHFSITIMSVSVLFKYQNTVPSSIIPPSGTTIRPVTFEDGHSQIPCPTCVPLWVCGHHVLIVCYLLNVQHNPSGALEKMIETGWAVVFCEGAAGWGKGITFSHILLRKRRIHNDALEKPTCKFIKHRICS